MAEGHLHTKPSIVEVIGARIELRRAGKEYVARCPFHDDHDPSFSVNADKGVYYCFGCGASGDVFDFLMSLDGLTFPEAKAALGVTERTFAPAPRPRPFRAAELLAHWLNRQHLGIGAKCRELSRQIAIADDIPDRELSIHLRREWSILSDLHEDLANPELAAELWAARESIEALTADVEPEPAPIFSPLAESYRAHLRSIVS